MSSRPPEKQKLDSDILNSVDFVLLMLSAVLLAAVLLIILLNEQVITVHEYDENVDIVFVERGRGRVQAQYAVWEAHWSSFFTTKWWVIALKDTQPPDPIPEGVTWISTDIEHEQDAFMHLPEILQANNVPSSQLLGRYFLWASDQVIPTRDVSPHTFHVPTSKPLRRYFSGVQLDNWVFDLEGEFEDTLPASLFSYDSLGGTYRDFILTTILGNEFAYSSIARHVVLVYDGDELLRSSRTLFQVVHISTRAPNPVALNEQVIDHWFTRAEKKSLK